MNFTKSKNDDMEVYKEKRQVLSDGVKTLKELFKGHKE